MNARESDGYTPLHVAVMFGFSGVFVRVIEALVAAGANVAIRNNAEDTPLDLAYKQKSKAAVIAALGSGRAIAPFPLPELVSTPRRVAGRAVSESPRASPWNWKNTR